MVIAASYSYEWNQSTFLCNNVSTTNIHAVDSSSSHLDIVRWYRSYAHKHKVFFTYCWQSIIGVWQEASYSYFLFSPLST